MELTAEVLDSNFETGSFEGTPAFLKNLIGYYLIVEGIFLDTGFAMVDEQTKKPQTVRLGHRC